MGYRNATICLNGHVISKYEANTQRFCTKCGQKTFSYCLKCDAPIHGKYEKTGVMDLSGYYEMPYYCYNCGEPYPWTQKILDNAEELIALDDAIAEESKRLIMEAIPDLLVESPTTPVAAAKYRVGISKAGKTLKEMLHNLLVDVISETAKKIIFPAL